jgi:hypothetical protein
MGGKETAKIKDPDGRVGWSQLLGHEATRLSSYLNFVPSGVVNVMQVAGLSL